MSYFSRYRKHPAGECSLCHKPLGELYLTLSRIQLPASRSPSAHCPPWELERSKVIAAYCPAHSLDVIKSKLQALGIASTNLPLTHGTWRCGCCGINPVNYSAPNTLYAVHTLNFNGWGVQDVFGELIDVLTCAECETSFTDPDSPPAGQKAQPNDSISAAAKP